MNSDEIEIIWQCQDYDEEGSGTDSTTSDMESFECEHVLRSESKPMRTMAQVVERAMRMRQQVDNASGFNQILELEESDLLSMPGPSRPRKRQALERAPAVLSLDIESVDDDQNVGTGWHSFLGEWYETAINIGLLATFHIMRGYFFYHFSGRN